MLVLVGVIVVTVFSVNSNSGYNRFCSVGNRSVCVCVCVCVRVCVFVCVRA